jgi:hypothetical protein
MMEGIGQQSQRLFNATEKDIYSLTGSNSLSKSTKDVCK